MKNLSSLIQEYLAYCETQKRLDPKTLKAYRIDLRQFSEQCHTDQIASVKPFFRYLEYRDLIVKNPFHKITLRFTLLHICFAIPLRPVYWRRNWQRSILGRIFIYRFLQIRSHPQQQRERLPIAVPPVY